MSDGRKRGRPPGSGHLQRAAAAASATAASASAGGETVDRKSSAVARSAAAGGEAVDQKSSVATAGVANSAKRFSTGDANDRPHKSAKKSGAAAASASASETVEVTKLQKLNRALQQQLEAAHKEIGRKGKEINDEKKSANDIRVAYFPLITCFVCHTVTSKPLRVGKCPHVCCVMCSLGMSSSGWTVDQYEALSDVNQIKLQQTKYEIHCPCRSTDAISCSADEFLMGKPFVAQTDSEYSYIEGVIMACHKYDPLTYTLPDDFGLNCKHPDCTYKAVSANEIIRHMNTCSYRQFTCSMLESTESLRTDPNRTCKKSFNWKYVLDNPKKVVESDQKTERNMNRWEILQEAVRRHAETECSNRMGTCMVCAPMNGPYEDSPPVPIGFPICEMKTHAADHNEFARIVMLLRLITRDIREIAQPRKVKIDQSIVQSLKKLTESVLPLTHEIVKIFTDGMRLSQTAKKGIAHRQSLLTLSDFKTEHQNGMKRMSELITLTDPTEEDLAEIEAMNEANMLVVIQESERFAAAASVAAATAASSSSSSSSAAAAAAAGGRGAAASVVNNRQIDDRVAQAVAGAAAAGGGGAAASVVNNRQIDDRVAQAAAGGGSGAVAVAGNVNLRHDGRYYCIDEDEPVAASSAAGNGPVPSVALIRSISALLLPDVPVPALAPPAPVPVPDSAAAAPGPNDSVPKN